MEQIMPIAEPGYVWHGKPFFTWRPRQTIDKKTAWFCWVRYAETWWIPGQKWAYDIWHPTVMSKTINWLLGQ